MRCLERKLPAGALLMTEGFTDVLEIGRHFRSVVYANKAEERALLIPRSRRYPIGERLRADGTVERTLDADSVRAAARRAADAGVKAIAICLLHAYANPEHELEAARIVQEEVPEAYVSCSHAVSPEIREFERASTTVLNALLMPVVKTYLSKLRGRLSDTGITAPVYLVQSNGGVTTPETAGEQPARLLLSGPAGGARAAEVLSAELGIGNLIAVDMGGTSYDVSIVDNGAIRLVTEGKVDGPAGAPADDRDPYHRRRRRLHRPGGRDRPALCRPGERRRHAWAGQLPARRHRTRRDRRQCGVGAD